ncbi:MAG: RsmB/NOP family class I SAM-dependent RNA methyltransferase [Rhizobiales bacterium]|nr:RsmB/NOP family class I SAM-dependent RNA methyltransferase [Hyphomicrobiales bacterium]
MGLKQPAAHDAARSAALALLDAVLRGHHALDGLLDDPNSAFARLDGRDRAFAHALAATALRRKGEADAILAPLLQKPLPKSAGPAPLILLLGVVQLRFLDVPAHAAIDRSVALAHADPKARHFAGLINAVLRRAAAAPIEDTPAPINTPGWLWQRWAKAYGDETAAAIARAHREEAPLDISAKSDAAGWAAKLGGVVLATGTIRIRTMTAPVSELPGFAEGAWWVQDAAAALPARLLGDVKGKHVADLCAAPGGKTAQLAASGAIVTAVDSSAARLRRLEENMARLKLPCRAIAADILKWEPDQDFDAILLDAPCSATGTIRRHPDLPYVKSAEQIAELAKLQTKMLDRVAAWVKPGGLLVYGTCSLELEEGERQTERFLAARRDYRRAPPDPTEIGGQSQFINQNGDLRIHPGMAIGAETGLDGFYAARLRRQPAS